VGAELVCKCAEKWVSSHWVRRAKDWGGERNLGRYQGGREEIRRFDMIEKELYKYYCLLTHRITQVI